MNAKRKGYAGQTGLFLPAGSSHVRDIGANAILLRGNPIEKQWPADNVYLHCHIKNITVEGPLTSGQLLGFGGYVSARFLSFAIYVWNDKIVETLLVSSQTASDGNGLYFVVKAGPGMGEHTHMSTFGAEYWYHNRTPQEIEVTYRDGHLEIKNDGEIYCATDSILGGSFSGAQSTYPIFPSIARRAGLSYDLVDFTYETEETSCRYVPMKTADGKDAIYEVYSRQVVEI